MAEATKENGMGTGTMVALGVGLVLLGAAGATAYFVLVEGAEMPLKGILPGDTPAK